MFVDRIYIQFLQNAGARTGFQICLVFLYFLFFISLWTRVCKVDSWLEARLRFYEFLPKHVVRLEVCLRHETFDGWTNECCSPHIRCVY